MLIFLTEIKNRLVLLILVWISLIITCYFYKTSLLFFLVQLLYFPQKDYTLFYFIFTNISEIFFVYIGLVKFISIQFVYLYSIYFIFMFFIPALRKLEFIILKYFFKFTITVWLLFLFALTNILLPLTWKFFISFQAISHFNSLEFYFEAKLSEYFLFFTSFYYFCFFYFFGLSCFFLLSSSITFKKKKVKIFRKVYLFFICFLSTVLSPPDVFSQIVFLTILFLFYETTIFFNILRGMVIDLVQLKRQLLKLNTIELKVKSIITQETLVGRSDI